MAKKIKTSLSDKKATKKPTVKESSFFTMTKAQVELWSAYTDELQKHM